MLHRPSTIPGDLDNWLQLLSRRCSPLAVDSIQRQERLAELAREVRASRPPIYFEGMREKRGHPASDLSSSDSSGANDTLQPGAPAAQRNRALSGSTPESRYRRFLIIRTQGKPPERHISIKKGSHCPQADAGF